MKTWFDELKHDIDVFFEIATDEDIQLALDKANYSFYKDVETPIIEMNNCCELPIYKNCIQVSLGQQTTSAFFFNQTFEFDKLSIADNDSYEYNAAA